MSILKYLMYDEGVDSIQYYTFIVNTGWMSLGTGGPPIPGEICMGILDTTLSYPPKEVEQNLETWDFFSPFCRVKRWSDGLGKDPAARHVYPGKYQNNSVTHCKVDGLLDLRIPKIPLELGYGGTQIGDFVALKNYIPFGLRDGGAPTLDKAFVNMLGSTTKTWTKVWNTAYSRGNVTYSCNWTNTGDRMICVVKMQSEDFEPTPKLRGKLQKYRVLTRHMTISIPFKGIRPGLVTWNGYFSGETRNSITCVLESGSAYGADGFPPYHVEPYFRSDFHTYLRFYGLTAVERIPLIKLFSGEEILPEDVPLYVNDVVNNAYNAYVQQGWHENITGVGANSIEFDSTMMLVERELPFTQVNYIEAYTQLDKLGEAVNPTWFLTAAKPYNYARTLYYRRGSNWFTQNLRKLISSKIVNSMAGAWLWYWYSFQDTVGMFVDIYAVQDILTTTDWKSMAMKLTEAKRFYNDNFKSEVYPTMLNGGYATVNHHAVIFVRPRPPWRLLWYLRLADMLGVCPTPDRAWDLIPMSFVVDFFNTMGKDLTRASTELRAIFNLELMDRSYGRDCIFDVKPMMIFQSAVQGGFTIDCFWRHGTDQWPFLPFSLAFTAWKEAYDFITGVKNGIFAYTTVTSLVVANSAGKRVPSSSYRRWSDLARGGFKPQYSHRGLW